MLQKQREGIQTNFNHIVWIANIFKSKNIFCIKINFKIAHLNCIDFYLSTTIFISSVPHLNPIVTSQLDASDSLPLIIFTKFELIVGKFQF